MPPQAVHTRISWRDSGVEERRPGRAAEYAAWFDCIFSNTSDAVFVVGPDLRILWWGPQAEQMLGLPAGKVVGRRCFEVIAGRHEAGQAECGPNCWVMRATRRGRSVPAFRMGLLGGGGERGCYTVGFMCGDSGEFLIHVLRRQELPRPQSSTSVHKPPHSGEAACDKRVRWLTPREREVLQLIMSGITSQDIAARLFISHATARNHVQNVLVKLGVHSRLEAAVVGVQAGLPLPLETPGVS